VTDIPTSNWSETAGSNNASPPDGFPEGQTAASLNNSAREMMAAIKREWNRNNYTVTAAGTGDAQTLTYTTAPTAYVKGMRFQFITAATNTILTPTLNVNGLGAVQIQDIYGNGIPASYLPDGGLVTVVYDGAAFRTETGIVGGVSGASGYTYLPNYVMEQWGSSSTVNGVKTVSFTVEFAAVRNIMITPSGGSGAAVISPLFYGNATTRKFVCYGASTESFGFDWRALGDSL